MAVILLSIFAGGCSMFIIPRYPEVIYNDRQPLISVTYAVSYTHLRAHET